jgi:hypothetical protein
MRMRREHDPDIFTTYGSRCGTLVVLVFCDRREYIVASRGLCFEPIFAGPFPGAQFLGLSMSEDVCSLEVSVGTTIFPCFESIASNRNLRRSEDGGNTIPDSRVLSGESLI